MNISGKLLKGHHQSKNALQSQAPGIYFRLLNRFTISIQSTQPRVTNKITVIISRVRLAVLKTGCNNGV